MGVNTSLPDSLTAIVNRAMAGDDEAREEVARSMRAKLLPIAGKLAGTLGRDGRVTVEGIVDEALEKVLRPTERTRSFPNQFAFFAYCTRCVETTFLEVLRLLRAQKRGSGEQHTSLEEARNVAHENGHLSIEERLSLAQALGTLRAEDPLLATIVTLNHSFGMSDDAIGGKLNMARSTVAKHRRIGLTRLKLLLQAELSND